MIGCSKSENVTELVYIGSLLTWDNDCNKEIKRRIATGAIAGFKTTWNSKFISMETKLSPFRTCVLSVLLYACKTLQIRDIGSLLAFEMRIQQIRWKSEDELKSR